MSLKALQEKIGVLADGNFGPKTLKTASAYFKFTPERAAHFFGQVATETGNFAKFAENLNYSASGLQNTFGKYFPGDIEAQYARQPEKIANRVYANRMGNGSEASGDGWKYRGRGALQLTGKTNYQAIGRLKDEDSESQEAPRISSAVLNKQKTMRRKNAASSAMSMAAKRAGDKDADKKVQDRWFRRDQSEKLKFKAKTSKAPVAESARKEWSEKIGKGKPAPFKTGGKVKSCW